MAQNLSSQAIFYNALAIQHNANLSALKKLFAKYGDWEQAFLKENHSNLDPQKLSEELEEHKIKIKLQTEADFPPLLKEMPHPPLAIYYKGNFKTLNSNCLAIVGTRKASKLSLVATEHISKNLAALGITIASGLALGVDSSAHKGALEAKGKTIAVLASGLDSIYPAKNTNLAKQILESDGTIISEYPIGTSPFRNFFIARNRIISGLAKATLVIEAPQKSGALATARFAVEQNRDLYVLPGSHKDKNFYGSNKLIQDGANLLMDYSEIAKDFGINLEQNKSESRKEKFDKLSEMQTIIVSALEKMPNPSNLDELSQSTKLSIPELQTNLSHLILEGIVIEEAGKYTQK